MIIVKRRGIFFTLTGTIITGALLSLALFGLHPGIDFTGGTLAQVTYQSGRPPAPTLQASLDAGGFSGYSLREASESDYVLRTGTLTPAERETLPAALSVGGQYLATIDQQTEVGPTIGTELRNKSLVALGLVLLCILLFIAFAFRKVSKPVSSWVYGLIALI